VLCTKCKICKMAEDLTCKIADQMCGVKLKCIEDIGEEPQFDTVYGFIDGPVGLELQFKAEPELFYHMAEKAIGAPPEDEYEVQDYATEFFNVLCGRFVSKLHDDFTHTPMRFHPPVYKKSEEVPPDDAASEDDAVCKMYFENDKKLVAAFCWNRAMMKELWKVGVK